MLAYMRSIIREACKFDGNGWLTYDEVYCRNREGLANPWNSPSPTGQALPALSFHGSLDEADWQSVTKRYVQETRAAITNRPAKPCSNRGKARVGLPAQLDVSTTLKELSHWVHLGRVA